MSQGVGLDPQTQLQSRLQQLHSTIQGVQDVAEETARVCTVAALDLEELGDGDKVAEVDAALRALLDAQHRLGVERDVVAQLAARGDADGAAAEYAAEWEARVGEYEALSAGRRYGRSAQYREFRQQVWDVRHEGEPMPADSGDEAGADEDLVIAGARMNYRCPIAASWLVAPLTSKTCGHSFSKDAIMSYIQAHRGACACPVDGCRQSIRAADLFPDQVLERKVARHLRQLEAEETAAQYTLVQ
ncbi:hypothetical protein H4R18_003201 [Coemansia javaensis]|uniref:SP-RING-type domain-containing protein n=1 Tax=Coemansia javaensis TaxID=2761396 RepID=A0A9W8LIY1_9FUNG|nr:hypothetical protein H4R18_003201 [Coemansia javaensis]